jgi:C-3',4' desaturase CrtD
MKHLHDVVVIGAGMSGLTAAVLLAQQGLDVQLLEQNWLPGGCVSAYPRHGFVFEAGATTLVGLDEGMPLWHVLRTTGIEVPVVKLDLPMQVHLADGQVLNRYQDIEAWIAEAERVFGPKGQRAFWEHCHQRSKSVWDASLAQKLFPPTCIKDFAQLLSNAKLKHVAQLPAAFRSTDRLLRKFGLHQDPTFRAFVDEQLLITAQNDAFEVNELFGATALCYTNYGNYYVNGGMIRLVQPFINYLEEKGGKLNLRTAVSQVHRRGDHYEVELQKGPSLHARYVISGIPLNNTLPIFGANISKRWNRAVLPPAKLRGAFSFSIAFKRTKEFPTIHHQIHLPTPLPHTGAHSIFVSLSHPDDPSRCQPDQCVASVSSHILRADLPTLNPPDAKTEVEEAILDILEARGILKREDILYRHSSTPKAWEKWTGRAYGFVGGYPQYLGIKPWQMKDARLDGRGAYICGDSTYPGQGIPGACLSGIIAVEKLRVDHF